MTFSRYKVNKNLLLVIAFIDLVAPKGAVCFVSNVLSTFMLALHGYGGLVDKDQISTIRIITRKLNCEVVKRKVKRKVKQKKRQTRKLRPKSYLKSKASVARCTSCEN